MDAILLAAGNSVRFGENKLLYRWKGKPVYRYILERLYRKKKEGLFSHLLVVSQYEEMFRQIETDFPEVEVVCNPHPEEGISGSIRRGLLRLETLDAASEACLFTVADQPCLSEKSLERLIRSWQEEKFGIVAASGVGSHVEKERGANEGDQVGRALCYSGAKNQPLGNPVIFSSRYYGELKNLTGDQGGKQVLYRHREDVGCCGLPAWELKDMDTREDMKTMCVGCSKPGVENTGVITQVEALPWSFLKESGLVISLVGAGGKTTLLYALAAYYGAQGKKVIVTTTTHIRRPQELPVAGDEAELRELLREHGVAAAGRDAPEEKLTASEKMTVSRYQSLADVVLVEADGAKRLPCKVPKEWEPVLPEESEIVIGVMGLHALGRPLEEVCFRKEKAEELLHVDGKHLMTERDLVQILLSEQGTRKDVGKRRYYIALSQCDTAGYRQQGGRIRGLLRLAGFEQAECISLSKWRKCEKDE